MGVNDEFLNYKYKPVDLAVDIGNDKVQLVQKNDGVLYILKEVDENEYNQVDKYFDMECKNVMRIYEKFIKDDKFYIIQEYVNGNTIEDMLLGDLIAKDDAFTYTFQILNGLQMLHSKNIIYRDISASNIIITKEGVAKIIDLGIAREFDIEKKKDTVMMGTQGYASPEQYGFGQSDARSDIYGVGVLLNKMLTGKFPSEEIYSAKGCEIIKKAIALDPKDRYQSADEMILAIREFQNKEFGNNENVSNEIFTNNESAEQRDSKSIWLPGFRTGALWKMIIASIWYALFIVFVILDFINAHSGIAGRALAFLLDIVIFIVGPFLACNIFDWDERIPGFRKIPKVLRITLRILLSIIIMFTALYAWNQF